MIMRKTIVCLLALTLLLGCLSLTSCGCNHEWGEWIVKSEVSCTREGISTRTCQLCEKKETETTAASGHSGDDVCTVCGAIVYEPDQLIPDYSSADYIAVSMENVTVYAVNGIGTLSINFADLKLALKDDGLLGKGRCTLRLDEAEVAATAFIADNKIYYTANQVLHEEQSAFYGMADIESIYLNNTAFNLEMLEKILSGTLGELTAPDEALTDALVKWIEEKLSPIFSEVALDVRMAQIYDLLNKGIASLYTFAESPDGNKTITLNPAKLKEWNNSVSATTVAGLYDLIFGEGKFEELENRIPSMLNYTLTDLLSYLELYQGIRVDALLTALDELAVLISEDESATFESLIGYEGDLAELITDPEMLSLTVADAFVAAGVATDANELDESIRLLVSKLKIANAYTLFGIPAFDVIKTRDEVNEAIDKFSEMFTWTMTLDNAEQFESLISSLTIPATLAKGTNISAVLTVTATDINLTVTMAKGEGVAVIPLDISFEVGEFDLEGLDGTVELVGAVPQIDEFIVTKCGFEIFTDGDGKLTKAIQNKPVEGSAGFFPGMTVPTVTTTVDLTGKPVAIAVTDDGSGILEIHLIYTSVRDDGVQKTQTISDFAFRYDPETKQIVG